jgi:hypothetical protein
MEYLQQYEKMHALVHTVIQACHRRLSQVKEIKLKDLSTMWPIYVAFWKMQSDRDLTSGQWLPA